MSSARVPRHLHLLLAFAVPLVFALITRHAWEDYFITLRSSRNLVEGNGLVFTPGERLHTFTSPLGVLIPAFFSWLVGPGREELGLWLFRLLSCAAIAFAVSLAWRRLGQLGVGGFGRGLFLGLLLSDPKLADFSTNGMETAVLVFFTTLLWCELESPAGPRAGFLALAVGGLMWTRPDAFILGGALLLPWLLLRGGEGASRLAWRPCLAGLLLGGLLYLPWFAWAWWYYGSPVPHTILAKMAFTPPLQQGYVYLLPWYTITCRSVIVDLFMPAYWSHGGWPALVEWIGWALALPGLFLWLVPWADVRARRLSLGLFLGMFYLCAIILFPWYVPPWRLLAALTLGIVVDQLLRTAAPGALKSVIRIACVAAVGFQAFVFVAVTWQMRIQQRLVEDGVRHQIGDFLRENAGPGDSVFLEPLGYIGYYSRLKTYDFPGLSSREVVEAVRRGSHSYADIIRDTHPTWLVLRPWERDQPSFHRTGVLANYELVRSWDTLESVNQVRWLPGRGWLENDARFLVYRRKPVPAAGLTQP